MPTDAAEQLDPRQAQRERNSQQWTGHFKQWKFLTPLIWAPAFPIIRHSTARMQPRARMIAVGTAIAIANLHGFWLINNPDLSDEALGIER